MNIILVGANGKMGKTISQLACKFNIQIIAKVDKNNGEYLNFNNIPQNIINCADMVLDFALPDVLNDELDFCIAHNKKLVICSTGHTVKQQEQIELASKNITIFKTSNTSIGVAIINDILKQYAEFFKDYKICILDKHHKNKKDAPSGTSKMFAQTLNNYNVPYEFLSVRAGTCVGEHQIMLFNDFEQINITHIAESRDLFAVGALKLCNYVLNLDVGLYDMKQILKKKK